MYPCALIRGNPPSTTWTQLIWNQLSLESSLTIVIYHFSQAGQQGERRAYPIIVILSPTCPPQRHRSPPYLQLIHNQGKLHTAPCYSVSLRATGGIFSLCLEKSFIHALTLFLLLYCFDRRSGTAWRQRQGQW